MTPPFAEAAGVTLLETVTRLLPLSDGGHRALLELLFGVAVAPALTLATVSGTLLATILALRPEAAATLVAAGRAARRPSDTHLTAEGRSLQVVAAGSAPMLVVSLLVRDRAVAWGSEPFLVGAGLLLTAGALASTFWATEGSRRVPTLWGAVLVGAIVGAASLPGLSQAGLGLACLLWLGLSAECAFKLCFLMMLPSQAALMVLGSLQLRAGFGWAFPGLLALNAAVATLALCAVRAAVLRKLLPFFSLYLVPLGIATLAWGYARP
jgi:undecaprenyl pyrophosphate phosphatase UppP